jgi:hypothetical protein
LIFSLSWSLPMCWWAVANLASAATPIVTAVADRERAATMHLAATSAIDRQRTTLARALRRTQRAADGAEVLGRAARSMEQTLTRDVLPQWLGVPWGNGANSLARDPFGDDATVNCGSFVVAVLAHIGFQFRNRDLLAQAPALRILEASLPEGAISRWQGSVAALERWLLQRGNGVYLLGLSRHIGFAVVKDGDVRLVHASRSAGRVISERFTTSTALLRSRRGGLFLGELVPGDPIVARRWLDGVKLGPQ